MTLGRLMELYQAEQQGKQIMKRTRGTAREWIEKVKITECDLKILANIAVEIDISNYEYDFFIKDEEDKYGNKINKNDKGKVR